MIAFGASHDGWRPRIALVATLLGATGLLAASAPAAGATTTVYQEGQTVRSAQSTTEVPASSVRVRSSQAQRCWRAKHQKEARRLGILYWRARLEVVWCARRSDRRITYHRARAFYNDSAPLAYRRRYGRKTDRAGAVTGEARYRVIFQLSRSLSANRTDLTLVIRYRNDGTHRKLTRERQLQG